MSEVHCFTSASFAYLDRVRVLAETLALYQPTWKLHLCLVDQEPEGFVFDPATELLESVVRVEDLGIPDLRQWMFQHDIIEACTAVKGKMLLHLFDMGCEKVIYFDPDIALFSEVNELSSLLDRHNVLLTPHQTDPADDMASIQDNEIGSLKWGIYNLGFLAVANTAEGRRFAEWWWSRLRHFCVDDVPAGLFTDQKWCNHVPSLFDGVHILRDPGYNVACWNIAQRPLSVSETGQILAKERPLRFFHFTKVNHVGERQLEKYCRGNTIVFELLEWYRDRLKVNSAFGLPERWWAYNCYEDGTHIAKNDRLVYRGDASLKERKPDPFAGLS